MYFQVIECEDRGLALAYCLICFYHFNMGDFTRARTFNGLAKVACMNLDISKKDPAFLLGLLTRIFLTEVCCCW
jgi:hypothetical protein